MNFIKRYLPPLIIIVVASAVALFSSGINRGDEPAKPDLDKSAWKTYTDAEDNFEMRFPPTLAAQKNGTYVRVFDRDTNQVGAEIFVVKDKSLEGYSYLGFESSSDVAIGDRIFKEFTATSGYCEGTTCGRPFSAYATTAGNKLFTVVFYDNAELSPQERAILGTMAFK